MRFYVRRPSGTSPSFRTSGRSRFVRRAFPFDAGLGGFEEEVVSKMEKIPSLVQPNRR
jgi:hypothetical protein